MQPTLWEILLDQTSSVQLGQKLKIWELKFKITLNPNNTAKLIFKP
jgi:hypothetical protein